MKICHVNWALGQLTPLEPMTKILQSMLSEEVINKLTTDICPHCEKSQLTECCRGCHSAADVSQAIEYHNKKDGKYDTMSE